ncbi:MAG: hypothetical protein ACTSSB_03480 [Candidatus Heimdallarchaeota archaeon]
MENENKNSTLLGIAITSLVGALLAIIGFVVPYYTYPNDPDHPGHTFLTDLFYYDGEYYQYLNILESVNLSNNRFVCTKTWTLFKY